MYTSNEFRRFPHGRQDIWRPKYNPWLIAVVVALAAFMEVLDTSIANVALPYMGGIWGKQRSKHLGPDFLPCIECHRPSHQRLARRRAWTKALFHDLLVSVHCEFIALWDSAESRSSSFFRVLQGAGGGGLQPMAQAILADTFPPQQRGLAFALYGITAVTAPTIGPTLGGWITFNYSWRWIFFINLPVGVATLFLVYRFVEDPPYLKRLRDAGVKLDYVGIALLTLGVGALQVLLDKGQEDDWFGSHFITTLVIVSAVSLIAHDYLGVESRCAHCGRSLIQEFQLRQLELDDVHFGNHVIQQPGHDAAVPSDAHGVHLPGCGTGDFRWRPGIAD